MLSPHAQPKSIVSVFGRISAPPDSVTIGRIDAICEIERANISSKTFVTTSSNSQWFQESARVSVRCRLQYQMGERGYPSKHTSQAR